MGPGGCGACVTRRSGRRPYGVVVAPVREGPLEAVAGHTRAMVMLTDPEASPMPVPEIVGALLDLTPTESRVATGLMQGRSLADVAEDLGVTMNTARTHLKRIFEKTRTSRQGELVAMMFRSVPGMKL